MLPKDFRFKDYEPRTELQHPLATNKYTVIVHESNMRFNAPHHFEVYDANEETPSDPRVVGVIDFQEGPIKECGVNGIANEDAIVMVLTRLEHFQRSPYACKENEVAIQKLEEALMWLRKRTLGREKRGVEGTNKV